MKTLSLVLAFAALTLGLHAQSSVWKVTHLGSTLYLGGTCHVLRASDFPLPPEFDAAYAATAKVYFETDLDRAQSPEMQRFIAQHGMLTDGRTLKDVISPAAWAAVEAFCAKRGLPVTQLQTMKPWLLTLVLSVTELQRIGISQAGVDAHFFQKARADGRAIGQLETFEEQLAFITGMAGENPSKFLLQGLADLDQALAEMPQLLAAWRTGNLAELDRLMNRELREKYPALHRTLLVDRNHAWMKKIDALFATPDVELILVGAGHMSGEEGLIAQLRTRGAKIEQLTATRP
jgi:uncharacterized protein YbaP (TraB family)